VSYCPRCAAALVPAARAGRTRLACTPVCGYVHWDNPVPVVAAVIEHEGEMILVRQEGWPTGWFGLVTGFLERDEEPAAAIVREIEEELGLAAEPPEWIGAFAYPEQNQLILAYAVRCAGTITLSDELSEWRRIAPAALRAWPFGTGKAVQAWLERRGPALAP
jgi:NADH pyrophosphatase NudC (nudix superfamily)